MKRSRDLQAQREQFQIELDDRRDERKLEVAFHAAHPQHSPEVGKVLATQFVAAILALTEYMEAKYRGKKWSGGKLPDHVPYWEIKSYLTEEQKAVLEAAYARGERVELECKAKSYDKLLETLDRCGLGVDTLVYEDGKYEDIITVEVLSIAKVWWDNIDPYEDGE